MTSRRYDSVRLTCYGFLLLALVAAPWMGLYPVLGTKLPGDPSGSGITVSHQFSAISR